MSTIASMLNDDARMVRGMFNEDVDPQLQEIHQIGLPMDALKKLLDADALTQDAAGQVRRYMQDFHNYQMVRLRIVPHRAKTYPHSCMPGLASAPNDDRQWLQDGNLYHFHTTLGGKAKSEQALYLWLCLAAPSTPEG